MLSTALKLRAPNAGSSNRFVIQAILPRCAVLWALQNPGERVKSGTSGTIVENQPIDSKGIRWAARIYAPIFVQSDCGISSPRHAANELEFLRQPEDGNRSRSALSTAPDGRGAILRLKAYFVPKY